MNVLLPSSGVTGKKFIQLNLATYFMMKCLSEEDQIDDHLKNKFISKVVKGEIGFLTSWDRDYLFTISLAAMRENKLKYNNLICTNEHIHSHVIDIEEVEVFDLPEGTKLWTPLEFNNTLWEFKIVQVEDEEYAYDLCLEYVGEFEQVLYDNIILARNLRSSKWECDYTNLDKFIDSIKKLPESIYMTAHMFRLQSFHGIPNIYDVVCPTCGEKRKEKLVNPGDVVSYNSKEIMEMYNNISDKLTYTEFLSLTVIDHQSLLNALNQENG